MKRIIVFFVLLGAAYLTITHPKVAALLAAAGIGGPIVLFCTAGVMDGILATLGAPSALADKILKGIGLLK